jgi:hypothetical protein
MFNLLLVPEILKKYFRKQMLVGSGERSDQKIPDPAKRSESDRTQILNTGHHRYIHYRKVLNCAQCCGSETIYLDPYPIFRRVLVPDLD